VAGLCPASGQSAEPPPSTWPQPYTVQQDNAAGRLSLATPYYLVEHDLRKGGAISRIRLTHGQAENLLAAPMAMRLQDDQGVTFTDLGDSAPRVEHRRNGLAEIVTVEARLLDPQGRASGVRVKTVFEYRWGYVRIRRELERSADPFRAREVTPIVTVLSPRLTRYGYREGTTEDEGAPPFAFGSNRWGALGVEQSAKPALDIPHVPRSMLFADPGVEGFEWFLGSDLAAWDLQLTGRRGQGRCLLTPKASPAGWALSVSVLQSAGSAVALPGLCRLDWCLGLPILEGHARAPWLHTSFNRNRGEWVPPDQIRRWAESGIQTVHCHNDGDYYDDGLFWRDGAYPPYPDMDRFDAVLEGCRRAGIRTATYFSNKELHPTTREFQAHGLEWGRMNRKGDLQHNMFRAQSEFGAQMCLRSGWGTCLRTSIDRVLKNHPLDGVYYDWNVALLCCNPLHEGKTAGTAAAGHWDMDELIEFMEWTRQRVGPRGIVIVHNTTTPMFATENFADYVVANEWGYGTWGDKAPALEDLPLEWSLVGARARGVISYGQIDDKASRRLHRVFALEALVSGVTPWPASPEAIELSALLHPLGPIAACRFADWRSPAVQLEGASCAAAVYSRPGRSYVLVANLDAAAREIPCTIRPDRLPHPLATVTHATRLTATRPSGESTGAATPPRELDAKQLTATGLRLAVPGDGAVVIELR